MSPADPPTPPSRPLAHPWQARLALAWAVGFGLLYARMVLIERLPTLARWLP